MGQEEFAQVLETMLNDNEAASRVGKDDFADLAEGELTGAERALLSAAASDLDDDVVGFQNGYIKIGDIRGDAKGWKVEEGEGYTEVEWTFKDSPNLGSAFGYLKLGDIKGE